MLIEEYVGNRRKDNYYIVILLALPLVKIISITTCEIQIQSCTQINNFSLFTHPLSKLL